jgi:hypothetical protein
VIKVSVKVGGDHACFRVLVCAESIQRAVKIMEDLYPSEDIQVMHPIDSEVFFADDSAVAGLVDLEIPERVAGLAGAARELQFPWWALSTGAGASVCLKTL